MKIDKCLAAIFIGGSALGVLLLYIDATEAAAYTFVLTFVAGLVVLPGICFVVDFIKSAPDEDEDNGAEEQPRDREGWLSKGLKLYGLYSLLGFGKDK